MSESIHSPIATPDWIHMLADFLRREQGLEAILLNPGEKKVSVATLGHVDLVRLQERLNAVLGLLDQEHLPSAGGLPMSAQDQGGIHLTALPRQTLLEKPSCPTAPRLWHWRDYEWPEPEKIEAQSAAEWKAMAWQAGICGAALLLGWICAKFSIGPDWLAKIFYGMALVSGGWDAAKDTFGDLRNFRFDVHFLMLAVAMGAVAINAWHEAALLLFLFSASGAMEHYAMHRTHREINSLTKSAPKTARVVQADQTTASRPVALLEPGDTILVNPDESFPADGEIVEGKTACDESNLTGESVPVDKEPGSPVFSGTLNLWGAVTVRVTRLAKESSLQKIVRLIQQAQHLRAPSQQFTDKFGTRYTMGILALTTVMFLLWWLVGKSPPFTNTGSERSAFYRAMTLLVVASPCALVLSIPSAILAAIATGAKRGILFRGGAAIEKLAEIDTVAMDKTGTLTTGQMQVEAVESFPPGQEMLVAQIAYSIETRSNHPLARAIVAHGKKLGLQPKSLGDFQSIPGKGIRAELDGEVTYLGRRELLELGEFKDWIMKVPDAPLATTEVWIVRGKLLGRLLLRDQIREESRVMLEALRKENVRTIMLTGDRRSAAETVAKELGVQEIRAGLSPEEKLEIINQLGKQGHKVAMLGDGVNDAPSLAAAYVSVGMGGRGSDAALEQSDVALMNDRIDKFVAARQLSRDARSIIKQNLIIALGTVVIMVAVSLFGLVPLPIGVLAHEGSTVIVCLNSLRLLYSGKSSKHHLVAE